MNPLVYAIHGILTKQKTASWVPDFASWCEHEGVAARIERKDYTAGPVPWFNTLIKNKLLARGIVAEILQDRSLHIGEGRDIHFVAHSNGTDIALKTVQMLARRGIRTHTIILVGSICEPDIERNGVAALMREGMLLNAYAYISHNDSAVGITDWYVIRRLCAYRDLGVVGWKERGRILPRIYRVANADEVAAVNRWCFTRDFSPHDHSTYFDPAHREETFAQFVEDLGL